MTNAYYVIAFLALSQVVVLCGVIYMVYCCIKLKHALSLFKRRLRHKLNMDCEELLENLLAEQPVAEQSSQSGAKLADAREQPQTPDVPRKRARLAAMACGGRAMHFKGRPVTSERIDTMEDAEIEELNARYEARLGAAMSKSLGSTLLRLYASAASKLLPLPLSRQPELVADLEQDPFVSSALQSACCELYYRYGMYLAPLTAALTTAKHCDWAGRVEDTATEFDDTTDNDGCWRATGTRDYCEGSSRTAVDGHVDFEETERP